MGVEVLLQRVGGGKWEVEPAGKLTPAGVYRRGLIAGGFNARRGMNRPYDYGPAQCD